MKMIFPIEDGIFQPAMLVYQRVDVLYLVSTQHSRLEPGACNQQLCHGTQFSGTLKIETMPGEPQFVCQPNASWLSFPSWDVTPLLVTSCCLLIGFFFGMAHCVPLI